MLNDDLTKLCNRTTGAVAVVVYDYNCSSQLIRLMICFNPTFPRRHSNREDIVLLFLTKVASGRQFSQFMWGCFNYSTDGGGILSKEYTYIASEDRTHLKENS